MDFCEHEEREQRGVYLNNRSAPAPVFQSYGYILSLKEKLAQSQFSSLAEKAAMTAIWKKRIPEYLGKSLSVTDCDLFKDE